MAIVAAVVIVAGHACAALGLWRGMPEPLYGDEARYWSHLVRATLQTVWMPWLPLGRDALPPAAFGRAIVPMLVLWLCGEFAVVRLRNPLRLFLIHRRGGHTVLFGFSPLARTMLDRWTAAGRSVLVLSADPSVRAYAVQQGAAFVLGDWRAEAALARVGLARAAAAWCIAQSDAENIEQAVAAARHVRERRRAASGPLALLVHVDDPFLRARIDERIDRFAMLESVQIRLFSVAQIAARRLFREHPPEAYRMRDAGGQPLWVFGLGSLGEEIVLQHLRLSHHREARRASVVVADRQAEGRGASFSSRWPGASAIAELRFEAGGAEEGSALFERLLGRNSAPAAVYFCLGAEQHNLAASMLLCEAFQRAGTPVPPLYVRAGGVGTSELGADLSEHPWFRIFGSTDRVADEVLMGERLDAVARTIHERYLADAVARGEVLGARRSLKPWALLAEDLKDDNRHLADHHFVKIRDAGAVALDGGAVSKFSWQTEEVEWLARVEHERWVAQRELSGWKFHAVRDDAKKLHPDMIPYAELAEERKELDRAAVRDIPPLLAQAGFALRRLAEVSVSGPPGACSSSEAHRQAIVAMLEELRSAGREPLLWTDLESEMACAAAELALERGLGRVGIRVRGSAHAVMERQPDDASRARVRRLLARAERVVVEPDAAREPASEAGKGLRLMLSTDGRDLVPSIAAWGIDAAGRVLFRPASLQ